MCARTRKQTKDKNDRREEALRPNPYLGYDRDKLGLHLLSRGAYKIAEAQFRRASWLNPFEYRFICHLAWSLFRQERYREAKECIEKIDGKFVVTDKETRTIIEQIRQKLL